MFMPIGVVLGQLTASWHEAASSGVTHVRILLREIVVHNFLTGGCHVSRINCVNERLRSSRVACIFRVEQLPARKSNTVCLQTPPMFAPFFKHLREKWESERSFKKIHQF